MKKLLITGASGYLGQHLVPYAVKWGGGAYQVYTTTHHQPVDVAGATNRSLDLTDSSQVEQVMLALAPDVIIHAAAVNPGQPNELMMPVNRDSTAKLATVARQFGTRFIYVSSDTVFDGRNAPYPDDAPHSPLALYGQSKAAGEQAVHDIYPAAVIARTSLIYGLHRMDRGTAGFMRRLEAGERLTLFTDVYRQPIWVDNLCEALLRFADNDASGAFNVAGSQALSRAEFGRRMLAWWQIGYQKQIGESLASDISDTIPLDLRMTIDKAEQRLGMPLLGVDDVLRSAATI